MKPFFLGIAGGSGSGKTLLARGLKKFLGKRTSILHLDIYQRFGEELPKIKGMENWDCPEAVDWKRLQKDLKDLKGGKTIKIKKREQRRLKIIRNAAFCPKEIIIIEGYLLFSKYSIRKFLDFLIFLKASEKTRAKRRTKFKGRGGRYLREVVLPMHEKYIEPTRKYATLVLNTDKCLVGQCVKKTIIHLNRFFATIKK